MGDVDGPPVNLIDKRLPSEGKIYEGFHEGLIYILTQCLFK